MEDYSLILKDFQRSHRITHSWFTNLYSVSAEMIHFFWRK